MLWLQLVAEGNAAPLLSPSTLDRALLARLQAPPDAFSSPFSYLLRRVVRFDKPLPNANSAACFAARPTSCAASRPATALRARPPPWRWCKPRPWCEARRHSTRARSRAVAQAVSYAAMCFNADIEMFPQPEAARKRGSLQLARRPLLPSPPFVY